MVPSGFLHVPHGRRWRRLAVAALALLTVAAPAGAAWHRLDSPNFVVVGDASPRQLRDVAVKFEAFREVLGRLRGHDVATAAVPTVILVFRSEKAFAPYTPRYQGRTVKMDGLFVPSRDVNHIAMVNEGADQASRIMYHEYAHLVIANATGPVPVWLNEGLAEVYSTFELTRGGQEALIGRTIGEHLALLRTQPLLKLTDLLQVDHESPLYNEGERRSVFYAQAWALVHMIIFGEPSRTAQLRAYLQRVSEGMPPAEAWTQAFGAERLDRELVRYVGRENYRAVRHTFSEKLSRFDATAQPLATAEVHAFFAHFLLAQRRHDEAREHLDAARKLDANNGHVRIVRALNDLAAGEHGAAVQRLQEVGEPEDWLAAYYAGAGLAEAVERTQDRRAEVVAAASRCFDAAARQRKFPNAVIRRATTEIVPGRVPSDATILAVQEARSAAPGREDYAFVHAHLLAMRSDFHAARNILGPLMALAYEPRVREAARAAMAQLVTLEKYHAQPEPAGTAGAAAAPADAGPPSGPDPTSALGLRPVFREIQADEERLDGLLERLECSVRGAVTFVLKTAEEIVRIPAARMSDVEFITYRDDLSGSVSCGPLKPPMRVYLTYRAASKPDGAKAAVAVEFLPKEMQ